MEWQPLGDQGLLAHAADERTALNLTEAVRRQSWDWVEEVVQAYTSLAVYYDPERIDFFAARDLLAKVTTSAAKASPSQRLHPIPVCYEHGLDFEPITQHTGLTRDAIIELHLSCEYTVYAIGFCPGFPYLGYLPKELAGVPRLPRPRLEVAPGSVGLTGRQTGIYTEPRPGGWNLVGRTPLELVNVQDGYFPLRTGDRVRFARIDEAEFRSLWGNRLP